MPKDGNAVDPVETRLQRALAHVADSPDVPAPPIADLVRADRRRRRRTTAVVGVAVILIGLLAFTLRGTSPESSLDVVTTPTPAPSTVEAPNRPAPFPSGSAVDPVNRQLLVPAEVPPIESGTVVGFTTPTMGSQEGSGLSVLRLFVDDGTTDQEVCPEWGQSIRPSPADDCHRTINAGGLTRNLWTAPEVTDPNGHTYTLHAAREAKDALALVSNRVEILVKPRGTVFNGTGVQLGAGGGVPENIFHVIDQVYGSFATHDWATLDKHLVGAPNLLHNEPGGWATTFGWVDGQFVIGTSYEPAPNTGAFFPSVVHAWVVLNGTESTDPSAGSQTPPAGTHVIECVTMRIKSVSNTLNLDGFTVEVIDANQRQSGPGRVSMTEAVALQEKAC